MYSVMTLYSGQLNNHIINVLMIIAYTIYLWLGIEYIMKMKVLYTERNTSVHPLTTTTSVFIFNFLIVIMIIWIANMMAISSSWQQQLSLDLDSIHRRILSIGIYPHTSYLSFLLVRKIAIK